MNESLAPKRSTGSELAPLLSIAAVAAFVAVLYASSFMSLAELWQRNDYRYGALVLPIAAFLLWRSRASLSRARLKPWAWGVVLLFVLVMAWALSQTIGVRAAEQLAAILMIPAAVATFLGTALAKRALFPLLFLIVAVPFGEVLIPPLMTVTADVSAGLLRAAGVPVFREGQLMSLPGGDFEVADVCAGLRYLIAGTMIGLLYAYVTFSSNFKRVVFVIAVAVSLILANGVRAFVTIYIASTTNLEHFAGRDHVYFGWLLFGAVIIALFWGGDRFADVSVDADASAASGMRAHERRGGLLLSLVFGLVMLAITAQAFQRTLAEKGWMLVIAGAVLLAPVLYVQLRASASVRAEAHTAPRSPYLAVVPLAVMLAAGVVLAAGPVWFGAPGTALGARLSSQPILPDVTSCSMANAEFEVWRKPVVDAPGFVLERTYDCFEQPVSVFVAGYASSGQGREFVGGIDRVLPPELQSFAAERRVTFANAGGRETLVEELRVQSARTPEHLVWYWYGVGDETATSATGAKLAHIYEFLTRGRSDARLYVLVTPTVGRESEGRERLRLVASAVSNVIESSAAISSRSANGHD